MNWLDILVLINQAIYCYGFIPLIAENYRLKTSRGVSDALMWTFFNAYIAIGYYFFCLQLPLFYKISVIIQLFFVCVAIGQRFWYDKFIYKKKLAIVYGTNTLVAIALLPLALRIPHLFGNIAGWIAVAWFVINKVPQIVKVQRERSVYGFSFGFVFMQGMAAIMEIVVVLAYGLPMQTLVTGSWALATALIFTWQFYQFSWREQ
jgi:hypothetical protein